LANELAEALALTPFNGYEARCIFFLLRKTYGYQKKMDWIPLTQWAEGTGLKVPHISRTLKGLTERKIVTKNGNKYGLNKNYREWRELPKLVKGGKVTKSGSKFTKIGKPELPKLVDSKYKRQYSKESARAREELGPPPKDGARVQPPEVKNIECKECGVKQLGNVTPFKDGLCLDCRQPPQHNQLP
jgi:phage replication O-like protein O